MISFDLDMTLLNHADYKVPDSARQALDELRKDHKIILATGRDMDTYYSRQYKDMVKPDAIIHLNGTKITVGDDLFFDHKFDRKLLHDLFRYCEEKHYCLGLTVVDNDYFLNPDILYELEVKHWGKCGRQFKDYHEIFQMPIRSLAFIGYKEQAMDVEREFPQVHLPLFASFPGADLIERGCSKADGLRRLARYFGEAEDLSTTVAFGDSLNDIKMIQAAGLGIAMGNAVPELKQVSDYVTTAIGDDGIMNACKHFQFFKDYRPERFAL